MKYAELVEKVSGFPFFTVGFLSAGRDPSKIRLQISRWVKNGKVLRIHKGLYTLAEPYRKVPSHPFCVANQIKEASYVSLQSALSWYGMIPEFVPAVTSVTTGRPHTIETPLGRFEFRHLHKKYFWGYRQIELPHGQGTFVARPEKALLDLVYLTDGGDEPEYLESLRLQHFEQIDRGVLSEYARRFGSPKIKRARDRIESILEEGEGVEL